MPNTTTATWPTLSSGQVARASDVEAKFDFSEHNLWPHSTGTRVSNAFDIGDSTTAYWRTVWAYSVNATTTAQGVSLFTTSVANNSDVALEIGGARTVLVSRFTNAQESAFTGINGMLGYNSTINQFRGRQNGAWIGMAGAPIGIVARVVTHSTGGPLTTTALTFTGSGRIVTLIGVGSHVANSSTFEAIVDSITTGNFNATASGRYIVADIDVTTGSFQATNTATRADIFFKNQLIVRQFIANAATTSTYISYEGS